MKFQHAEPGPSVRTAVKNLSFLRWEERGSERALFPTSIQYTGFPGSTMVRTHLSMWARQETQVQSPGREEPLEEEMATHSSILAWRIP